MQQAVQMQIKEVQLMEIQVLIKMKQTRQMQLYKVNQQDKHLIKLLLLW